MRVVVDLDKCESHGCCMATVPEVFELGDDDRLRILVESPPASLASKVESAVAGCPKQALSLIA